MSQEWSQLGEVVDRAAARLYGDPLDRDALFDVATVLSLVNGRVARLVSMRVDAQGMTHTLTVINQGSGAVRRKLLWLRETEPCQSTDDVARLIARILHILARLLVLGRFGSAGLDERYPHLTS